MATYTGHLPIWVELEPMVEQESCKKCFCSEAMWTREEECWHIIEQTWPKEFLGPLVQALKLKVKECSDHFMHWNIDKFGNVQKSLVNAKKKLSPLHENDHVCVHIIAFREVQVEVNVWLEHEELF